MATSSPAPSNISSDSGLTPAASVSLQRNDGATPKTLRGLNKPKCIQCGNVARSRCPYQSCKSCCSKAQNPCLIHVLKANTTIPDRAPPSTNTNVDQQSADLSSSTSSLRVASLRQLSNTFSQFNNLHSARSKKPLTKKEALAINEWRFNKLKEYKDRVTEKENEAFDRYMQNIRLLEEAFSMKSTNTNSEHKSKSLADPTIRENFKKRKQHVIDEGLRKLEEIELDGDKRSEKVKLWSERASSFNDLIEKLNKARNEDDIKSCLEMKSQLFESCGSQQEAKQPLDSELEGNNGMSSSKGMECFSQKQIRASDIDQEMVSKVNAHFTSLKKIANL